MEFYSFEIDGTSGNEALNHIVGKNIDCRSMAVILNILLLKYYNGTTYISVHSIQFQIVDLDFAIQY